MHKFGLPGEVRWDAPLDLNPDSYKSLVGLAYLYRDIERSYTQSPELSQAIEAFSGAGATAPTLQTGLFDLERQADQIVAELEQPIQTTSVAGIVIGDLPLLLALRSRCANATPTFESCLPTAIQVGSLRCGPSASTHRLRLLERSLVWR
jgi:hypothetical protein